MNFFYFKPGVTKPPAEWARNGKVEWPDVVTVTMTRRDALRHLAELANQLHAREGDEIDVTFTGKLERQASDDRRPASDKST